MLAVDNPKQFIAAGVAFATLTFVALRAYREDSNVDDGNFGGTEPAAIKVVEEQGTRTLYERLGGEAAVDAAVDKFYKRMLADDRVSRFFQNTNMIQQHAKQRSFMSFALGSPKKYAGVAMDRAHRRLIKDGMTDFHYDATCENLDKTLEEMGVGRDLRSEVRVALEGLREQVMCRGKWTPTD